jgi:hypothetical protein
MLCSKSVEAHEKAGVAECSARSIYAIKLNIRRYGFTKVPSNGGGRLSLAAGNSDSFSVVLLVDVGYTNALGTYKYLLDAVNGGDLNFSWHGGDLLYVDD